MAIGSLLTIVLVLVVLGVGLYLVEKYIPMAEPFKIVIRVVVVIVIVLWLLSLFGILNTGVRI